MAERDNTLKEKMFSLLKERGSFLLKEVAISEFGDDSYVKTKKVYNTFYFNKKTWSERLGKEVKMDKGMVYLDGETIQVDPPSEGLVLSSPKVFEKTAVIVVTEKRSTATPPEFSMKVLGDLNRNMTKEVLKQLMEAFV